MINPKYLSIYLDALSEDAKGYENAALASDAALSLDWVPFDPDTEDPVEPTEAEVIERFNKALKIIKLARDMTVADLADLKGITHTAFAKCFAIPIRTFENWSAKVSTPPPYVKLLIAESIGYFD